MKAFIKELKRVRLRGKQAKEVVRQAVVYFEGNQHRMEYERYFRGGYHIGSGVVESGCKYVVGARLKGAGMHWSEEGAEAIGQVRV